MRTCNTPINMYLHLPCVSVCPPEMCLWHWIVSFFQLTLFALFFNSFCSPSYTNRQYIWPCAHVIPQWHVSPSPCVSVSPVELCVWCWMGISGWKRWCKLWLLPPPWFTTLSQVSACHCKLWYNNLRRREGSWATWSVHRLFIQRDWSI